jgi:hypothetical protein
MATKFDFITEVKLINNNVNEKISYGDVCGKQQEFCRRPTSISTPFNVTVINAPENMHDEGRHRACAEASTALCFYIDDDFLPQHVDVLVASYLRFPNRIHAFTNERVYWNNRRWSFKSKLKPVHMGTTAVKSSDS